MNNKALGLHVWYIQGKLWREYAQHIIVLGNGISAMPSLHVAVAFMWPMFMWRQSRVAGVLLYLFAVLSIIATIVLGWHYFVDSVVAILGAVFIYYLSRWVVYNCYAVKCTNDKMNISRRV